VRFAIWDSAGRRRLYSTSSPEMKAPALSSPLEYPGIDVPQGPARGKRSPAMFKRR
jgi:hypothetical protein